MGVDYYNCDQCGEIYPDCGTYYSCDLCSRGFCSECEPQKVPLKCDGDCIVSYGYQESEEEESEEEGEESDEEESEEEDEESEEGKCTCCAIVTDLRYRTSTSRCPPEYFHICTKCLTVEDPDEVNDYEFKKWLLSKTAYATLEEAREKCKEEHKVKRLKHV